MEIKNHLWISHDKISKSVRQKESHSQTFYNVIKLVCRVTRTWYLLIPQNKM